MAYRYDISMRWDVVDMVESVAGHLRLRAVADDQEQAVYGIDALDELGLHPLIHAGLRAGGYGVHPEQRYPCDRVRRRRSEGKRCDVVLTPEGRTLMDPDAEATLFEPTDGVVLESAYWLEIKTVSQFTTDGPFAGYSRELLQPVAHDVRKLASDRLIHHAGLLVVLFTADRGTAEHDLKAWEHRALQRGYAVASPIIRGFALNDRLGNGYCAVALSPIRRL